MEGIRSDRAFLSSLLQALDHAGRALVVLDADRRVVYHNRRYQEMWGFPSEFLRQNPHIEDCIRWACRNGVYPPDQEEELVARRLEHLVSGAPLIPLDTPRQDGTTVEGYAAPLPQGGWVLSFRDTTQWQQMLAELQASEARHRAILEALPDFVLICSPERRVQYMNEALVRHLGRDVTGEECAEALAGVGVPCPLCPVDTEAPQGAGLDTILATSPDGKTTRLVSYTPLPGKNGSLRPSTLVVLRDITDQVARYRQINELVRLQKEILRSAGEGIVVADENLVLQIWNPVMERWSGVATGEAVGRPLGEVLGRGGKAMLRLARKALGGRRASARSAWWAPRQTDTRLWISATFTPRRDPLGEIKGVVGIIRDVTRQKLAEDARKKSEFVFRALVEHTHAVPWEFDLRARRFTYMGPQAAEITGYAPETWTDADSWMDRVHPDDRDHVLARVRRAIREKRNISLEYRLVRSDGTMAWVLNLLTVFRGADGSWKLLGFVIDVTKKKQEAEERRQFEDRLRNAERMESLGVLAGGVAHDFNNLLTPILAHAEILQFQLPAHSPLRRNAAEIVHAAQRAADLTKQILAFSRETGGEQQEVALAPLVKETVKFVRSGLPSSVVVRERFKLADERIRSDPTKIHQIVMNLCVNALQAMEGRGTLEVGLEALPAEALPAFSEPADPAARYARLWVQDTGPGIPEEIVDRIFEPFFTTKKEQGGTGMGLANVHRIVRELGGGVRVASRQGEGARFDVYLPLLEGNGHGAGEPADGPGFRRGSERILLVDDERAVVDMLSHILGDLGYRVWGVGSGTQAIELLERSPDEVDVLLVDWVMPGMSGLEVIRRARSLRKDLPVILCSGQPMGDRELVKRGVRAPATVLPKPISMASLSDALRKVLDSDSNR